MNKKIIIAGSIMALIAVLLGAFGAHGLEKFVAAKGIDSFVTGVRYQMYHALACLMLGMIPFLSEAGRKKVFYCFLSGITLFSGSIYLLVIDDILGVSFTSIAFLTPVGGLLLIIGWILFIIFVGRSKEA